MQISRSSLSRVARRGSTADLTRLRGELDADHARLLLDLKTGRDRLIAIGSWSNGAIDDPLLIAYKTLIAIVEREDFSAMPLRRMPVVLSHIASRLERLRKLLRASQALTMTTFPMSLH